MKTRRFLPLILAVAVLLNACSLGQSQASPTADAQAMATVVAAVQTNVAATNAAQSANTGDQSTGGNTSGNPAPTFTAYPTYTPYPTFTPLPMPTNTATAPTPTKKPTILYYTSTPTAQPQDYACSVLNVVLSQGSELNKSTDFDSKFTIQNTGAKSWVSSDMDVVYYAGEDTMVKHKIYDLPKTVNPGQSVDITIDLTSPSNTGNYSVEYRLRGGSSFCSMTTNIKVK